MAFSHKLKTVVNLVGKDSAICLVRRYGGRSFKVPSPQNLKEKSALVQLIGFEAAYKLCVEFEAEPLKLPHECTALQQILKMQQQENHTHDHDHPDAQATA